MATKPRRSRRPSTRLHRRTPPGAPPGVIAVDPLAKKPQIQLFAYGPEQFEEREILEPNEIAPFIGNFPVLWVNVEGLGDADTVQEIGRLFGIHPLVLEDIVNVHQRPKVEEYEGRLFIVAHMVSFDGRLESEQLSLFLGDGFLVTFQEEKPGDCLAPVRQRLRGSRRSLREAGADFLAYSLIDALIDQYFPILERYSELMQDCENAVLTKTDQALLAQVQDLRMDLFSLRRYLWPLRDVLNSLLRDEFTLIQKGTRLYLRDCYDHSIQALDLIEMYRELASGVMEMYLSNLNTQMNEVMKVLTTIATIFIPITFVAGVYGMNFDTERSPFNMPELKWTLGYPFALLVMVGIVVTMLVFFRRRKWI